MTRGAVAREYSVWYLGSLRYLICVVWSIGHVNRVLDNVPGVIPWSLDLLFLVLDFRSQSLRTP